MTSVAKISPRRTPAGFTLLEIMFTISLIAILVSVSIVAYKPDSPAKRMRTATIKIEAMAARGHTMAKLHQKPFWLRFERGQVVLEGAALDEVDRSVGLQVDGEEDFGDDLLDEEPIQRVEYDSFPFPEGMEVYLRRWGADEIAWFHQKAPDDPVLFWNFGPNGLCEPVAIKFEIEKSWAILEMDPMTARVADETSEIYD